MASPLKELRQHPQMTAFSVGAVLASAGAVAWTLGWANGIFGSLLVGVGSSVIAAALVANLSPMSEEIYKKFLSLGVADVYASRMYVPGPEWVEWLRNARSSCVLLGTTHGKWCADAQFRGALIGVLKEGVHVEIFFLNPKGSAIAVRAPEDAGRDTADIVRRSIKILWGIRDELDGGSKASLELYLYDATPSCGLTWVDGVMVVTHYLAGIPNPNCPVLVLERPKVKSQGKDLYGVYEMNMQAISRMESTIKITEDNVNEFI